MFSMSGGYKVNDVSLDTWFNVKNLNYDEMEKQISLENKLSYEERLRNTP